MPRFGILLSLVLVGASLAMAMRPARAAVKEFPYEAVVEADETFVRCGPGKNFYPTLRLTRGQHVTVRRHDPGGWFMIEPPAGSFSLIRVEDVVQEGNIATVKRLEQGQACVRIGSSVDPTNDSIFQRKLSTGERAEILGEVMIPRKDRTVPMFRIRPPRGEFRWIEGNDLAPLDPQIKQQQDNDPFTTPPRTHEARNDQNRQSPSSATTSTIALSTTSPSAPTPKTTGRPSAQSGKGKSGARTPTATAQNGKTSATQPVVIGPANFDPRGRLDQIDVEFRDMIQKDPPAWNLGQIEQAYLELKQNPAAAGVANQVDLRFSALSHYKQVKAEYDDYYRLVSNTSRRDAELAAVENSLAPQNSRPPIGPTQGTLVATDTPTDANFRQPNQSPNAIPTLSLPGNGNQSNGNWQSSGDGRQMAQGQPQSPQGPGSQSQVPQFEGAPQPSAGQPAAPQDSLPQFSQQTAPPQQEPRHGPVLGAPVPLEDQPSANNGSGRSLDQPAIDAGNDNVSNGAGHDSHHHAGSTGHREQPANVGESAGPGQMPSGPAPQPAMQQPPMQVGPMQQARVQQEPAQQGQMQQAPMQLTPTQQMPAQPGQPQMRTYTSQFAPNPGAPGQMYSAYPGAPAYPGAAGQPGAPGQMPLSGIPNQPYAQQNMGYPLQYPPGQNAQPFAAQQGEMPHQMPQQMQQQLTQQMPSPQPGMPQMMAPPGAAPQVGAPPAGFPNNGMNAANAMNPANGMNIGNGMNSGNGMNAGTPPLAAPRQIHPSGSPALDGAGIVQRAATTSPNGPRHVLLAPNGRILAYLQGDRGVNLDAFVGRSMGIMGARAYQAELQTDLIVVRGVVPVQLVQP